MTWAVIAWGKDGETSEVPTVELFSDQEEAAQRALIFAQYVPTAMVKTKEYAK
jgi:hypothetical protein